MTPALQIINERPALAGLVRQGRLQFWGRVEPEALPELYSRSTVTVMPSRYEPFGIAGLMAMACGSPLIASAVGGLQHVVVHKVTGYAIPPDDPLALAWAISGFLRPNGQRQPLSRNGEVWAQAFSMDRVAAEFRRLYRGEREPAFSAFQNPLETIAEACLAGMKPTYAAAGPVTARLRHRHATEWHETPTGHKVRKTLDTWPTADASMFDLPQALRTPSDAEHIARVLFHRDAPWAVPVEDVDILSRTLTFPALEGADPGARGLRAISGLLEAMRQHRPVPDALTQEIDGAWRTIKTNRRRAELDAFDMLAATLQTPVLGAADVFQRAHPGVELVRLALHALEGAWPLDPRQKKAIPAVCQSALDILPDVLPPPMLCHGDVKRRHVLRLGDRLVLCDFEETHYAIGSFDEAQWLTYEVLLTEGDDGVDWAAQEIAALFDKNDWQAMTVAWCVSTLVYRGLWCAMRGDVPVLDHCLGLAERLVNRYVMT